MNKKIQKIFVAAILSLSATQVFADIVAIKEANNQIGISFVATHVDYKETLSDGTIFDTEKGWVPGFGLSISAMKDVLFGNDYFEASFTRLNGNTNYQGSRGAGIYPGIYGSLAQSNGAQTTDMNVRYGRGFVINDQWMITPYAEIGHHQWKRNLGTTECIPMINPCGNSASEDYSNNYFSLGGMGQFSPNKTLVLSLNGSVGSTFNSSISGKGTNIAASCSYYCYSLASFGSQHLGSNITYKISALADYAFTKNIHGNIGLNYSAFKYGKSALFNEINYEPDSKTNYTTVNVGLGYSF